MGLGSMNVFSRLRDNKDRIPFRHSSITAPTSKAKVGGVGTNIRKDVGGILSARSVHLDERTEGVCPPSLGWLQYKLTSQEMDYLWKCIDNRAKTRFNQNLAGHIDSSYELKDAGNWFYLNTIIPLIKKYIKVYGYGGTHLRKVLHAHPYYMNAWWVNYQKETEFNPIHDHQGIFSFVIWMKIPTRYEEQRKLKIASQANSMAISNFEFNYLNILGNSVTYCYEMEENLEGSMLFFPAPLQHQVYPFYNCKEDRISISGNINLNTSKRI